MNSRYRDFCSFPTEIAGYVLVIKSLKPFKPVKG